jgi:hypothetical protein
MIKIRRSVLKKILKRIPLVVLGLLILLFLIGLVGEIFEDYRYRHPYYFRADDVQRRKDELLGRKIRVRGELSSGAPQTAAACDPPVEVDTRYTLRGVDFMECRVEPDECAMTCPLFEPGSVRWDAYEIVGTLSYCPDGYLCLTDIEEIYWLESYSIELKYVTKVPITPEPVTFPIDEP